MTVSCTGQSAFKRPPLSSRTRRPARCPLLTGSGYDIIEAADGSEGVAKARADLPDLILMDIQLPVL